MSRPSSGSWAGLIPMAWPSRTTASRRNQEYRYRDLNFALVILYGQIFSFPNEQPRHRSYWVHVFARAHPMEGNQYRLHPEPERDLVRGEACTDYLPLDEHEQKRVPNKTGDGAARLGN